MTKFYTGVGSRKTPKRVLDLMRQLGLKLESDGYVLRSGGAFGADQAFESLTKNAIIYIPWKGYNGYGDSIEIVPKAYSIAKGIHPAWDKLSRGGRKLHARNVYQVLGESLSLKSKFLICWTENAEEKGGTATSIRLAKKYSIPVFNLADITTYQRLEKYAFS